MIARASSTEYRGSTKSPQEIGKELRARYLLTGTVRSARANDGTSRVEVSPELVDLGAGAAPTSRWQESFDASPTDVFKVQSDIAGKVADALNVALGAGEQDALRQRPTENLPATTPTCRARRRAPHRPTRTRTAGRPHTTRTP